MKIFSRPALFLIGFYRAVLSPLLGGGKCRFYPTCSQYAAEAVDRYGFFYGAQLAVRRLLRCGPWSGGGYDPVPETLVLNGLILTAKNITGNVSSSKG